MLITFSIIKAVILKKVGWAGHVLCIGGRNGFIIYIKTEKTLGRPGVFTRIMLKWICGLDSFHSEQGPVAGCYVHGIEPRNAVKPSIYVSPRD